MKRLLRNIILFCVPLLVVLIILPVDKRSKYQGLEDDCFNHGIWIYDRVFNNKMHDVLPIAMAMLEGETAYREGRLDEAWTALRRGIAAEDLAILQNLQLLLAGSCGPLKPL